MPSSITEGVNQVWGTLRVVIEENDFTFTEADSGTVSVWEDDGWGDPQLWFADITVTPAEMSAGQIDRTLDVSWLATPDDSGGDNVLEVYGYAVFDKYESYFWDDLEAQTDPIDVTVVPVPEPGSFALLSLGLLGLAVHSRRTS